MNTFYCPYCNAEFDAATDVKNVLSDPEDGDLSLCIRCGEPAVFVVTGELFSLRAVSAEERAVIIADEDVRSLMMAIQAYPPSFNPPEKKGSSDA
jgi:hypothetical protein